jgi:hypothetical protein
MYNVYISGEMLVLFVLKMNQLRQLVPSQAWYRLSDWFTFRTSTNTTNISPYAYTLYSHERHVQCICIGRGVGDVCACFKGEPVRQLVPSHERHVQCICIGRDVGGVCACFKGEPVRQLVPTGCLTGSPLEQTTPTSLPIDMHCT